MKMKRIIALILALVMAMTLLAGCGSKTEEESGMVGEFVEDQEETRGESKPQKGQESEIIEMEGSSKDETSADLNEDPTEEEPSDEETKEEQKNEQSSTDKNTSSNSGQQTQKPSNNQQNQSNSNNNQQTQNPNEEEEDWDDENDIDEDETFLDEDGDGEPDEGYYPNGNPGGGTPVQKPDEDTSASNNLKIVAYNVRVKNDGNGNDVADRNPRFKAMVEEYQPDIMALSEAGEAWIKYLEKNIVGSKYAMIYTYRASNSKEAQPLLYDKTKFQVLDSGYFWLSETPDVASKGWGGEYYRGATWAKLRVKDTGKTFIYYSTHLTGNDAIAVPSAKLIYSHAKDQGGFVSYPVFVSGDFNFKKGSAGYNEITKYFTDINVALGYNSTPTYTPSYNQTDPNSRLIDYVMYSPGSVTPLKYQVIQKKYLGGYISDHRGLYVEVTLK